MLNFNSATLHSAIIRYVLKRGFDKINDWLRYGPKVGAASKYQWPWIESPLSEGRIFERNTKLVIQSGKQLTLRMASLPDR